MAELFLKQGQLARALAIYRKLAKERPDDPGIRRRLAELEGNNRTGETMGYHEQIQNIVDSVPGALAAIIMGFDGIPIDTYEKTPGLIDTLTVLTEYSSAVLQVRRAAKTMEQPGAIEEISIASEKLTALMRPIASDTFVGVLLNADALTGKARYLLRIAAPQIADELMT